MNRLTEIETRLSAIKDEMIAEGADIDALTVETDALLEERKQIMDAEQKRQSTLAKIAAGEIGKTEQRKDENNMDEKRFAIDSAEYRDAFFKSLMGKELTAEERTAVSASAAIPTTTLNQIVGKLEENPLLAAIDIMNIPNLISIPVADAVTDANWVAMGTAATDGADSLTSVALGAYKLIKTVEITADVEAMAIPAFESWLATQLANKIEACVDVTVISGNGTGKATGLATTISTATGSFTKAGMTYKELMAIIASLPTRHHKGAKFVMPRTVFYGDVLGMVDANGRPVVVADPQSPAKYNVLGYPVIVDDNAVVSSTDNVFFGDLKQYKFNFSKAIEVSKDGSVGFRSGSTVYRAMALADGKLADSTAIVRYTRKAS